MATEDLESPSLLARRLAEALPNDARFTIYHVSTPPLKHEDIFAAIPNQTPERAYCESQTLSVAIRPSGPSSPRDGARVGLFVFSMEVLIYSNARLTTLFVSKTDSTGYLHQLGLPKGAPSPLKTIASTFLSYLVRERKRSGIKLMVSLFARAQDQYLFPGSSDNPKKHVLDDRGLIKWWCRVLDPLTVASVSPPADGPDGGSAPAGKAYVVVPGLDRYETAALFPPSVKADATGRERWQNGHPLHGLSSPPDAPPRCLIPRFPDDPKARYMDELDEELPETAYSQIQDQPLKRGNAGFWRSIQTLDQFWEAMEFRQECSSGRSVGFIWTAFAQEAEGPQGKNLQTSLGREQGVRRPQQLPTPDQSQSQQVPDGLATGDTATTGTVINEGIASSASLSHKRLKSSQSRKLRGPIIPRKPRVKTASSGPSSRLPIHSRYYFWPAGSRGQLVLNEKDYKRVYDLLLRLEFATPEAAEQSTQRWVEEAAVIAGQDGGWGEELIGRKHVEPLGTPGAVADAQSLSMGLIRKKRKDDGTSEKDGGAGGGQEGVSTLSAGLIRKKPKANG